MTWLQTAWDWIAGLWPWLAGGGLLVVIGVLAALNPVLALRVAKAIGAFVLGKLLDLFTWLREEANAYKAACLMLAVIAGYGLLSSHNARERIVLIERDRAAEAQQFRTKLAEQGALIEGYERQEEEFARQAREAADKLKAAQDENAEALAEIAHLKEMAKRNGAAWRRVYDGRPDSCKAAIEALDAACPMLRGY